MTVGGRITDHLSRTGTSVCDDCLTIVLGLTTRRHAYNECERIARGGSVTRSRGFCARCGKHKKLSTAALVTEATSVPAPPRPAVQIAAAERPWFWEGNVQGMLVNWLRTRGYRIHSLADTASREPGTDIVARDPGGQEERISVKGWPQRQEYTQARHWFADAVLGLLLSRDRADEARLSVALPAGYVTYQNLLGRLRWLRRSLPLRVYWVASTGEVTVE